MTTVRVDVAAVRILASRVDDGAERLHRMRWPRLPSDALAGSTVDAAVTLSAAEARLDDVVARLRSWAATARAAAADAERSDERHADRLGDVR